MLEGTRYQGGGLRTLTDSEREDNQRDAGLYADAATSVVDCIEDLKTDRRRVLGDPRGIDRAIDVLITVADQLTREGHRLNGATEARA